MPEKDDPKNEGHTREWQDRARVVLDAKKDAGIEADPHQSPVDSEKEQQEEKEKRKEQDGNDSRKGEQRQNNSFYWRL